MAAGGLEVRRSAEGVSLSVEILGGDDDGATLVVELSRLNAEALRDMLTKAIE